MRATRWVFWGLSVLYAVLVVNAAIELPDRVPTHWSGATSPDSWGSRGGTVVMMIGLGVIIIGLFAGLQILIPRNSRFTGINIPNRDYWTAPENISRAREMLRVDLAVLGCLTVAFICALPPSLVSAAAAADHALPGWFFVALGVWLAAILGYTVWMLAVRWRIPTDDQPGW